MFSEEDCQILRDGGVGVIPTDTVYGLVALASNQQAVERVYEIKGRDFDKRCIILAAATEDLASFGIDEKLLPKMEEEWRSGRPTSLEVGISTRVPHYLSRGFGKMSFRIPANFPELIEFLKCTGPLIGPSANLQDDPPATTVDEAKASLKDSVNFYIDGGKSNDKPSRVVSFNEQGLGNIIRE